jgi:hypothetical protein
MEFGYAKNNNNNKRTYKRRKTWQSTQQDSTENLDDLLAALRKDTQAEDHGQEDGGEEEKSLDESEDDSSEDSEDCGEELKDLGLTAEDIDSSTVKEILSIAEQISSRDNLSRLEGLLILSLIASSLLLSGSMNTR